MRIIKRIILSVAISAWSCGGAAEPELAGSFAVAPFAEVSAKVSDFGLIIGNPIVPALLLASIQQSVASTYGSFRTDAPLYAVSYSIGNGQTEEAVIYPSVDRIARMALANPGSVREGKDLLHIVPTDKHPNERYAVFSTDARYVSFASTAALARRALADCPPEKQTVTTLVSAHLEKAGVNAVCAAGRTAGVTNVINLVRSFTHLDVSLDMTARGLVIAFAATRTGSEKAEDFNARLVRELKGAFHGASTEANAVQPTVTVTAKGANDVVGEVALSRDQLKMLGKDFNTFVTDQMSGAVKEGKNGKKKSSVSGTHKNKDKQK